jgi:hypothetical protein
MRTAVAARDSVAFCASLQPDGAAKPEGCSCSQSVPAPPVGSLPAGGHAHDQPLPPAGFATLPPDDRTAAAFPNEYLQDQPLWPVPARILLCVWRN